MDSSHRVPLPNGFPLHASALHYRWDWWRSLTERQRFMHYMQDVDAEAGTEVITCR
jgi:hypothetical protein